MIQNPSKDPLNEREFELINIVGAELATNQRDVSRHLNLSLGMTNMLIRRLIAKGYIRISQLNQKKVKYLLTPKGFSEKMRKSIKYTIKTISSIGLIKNCLKEVLSKQYAQGERKFYILGESDFAALVEIVLKESNLNGCDIKYIKNISEARIDGVLCICKEGFESFSHNGKKHVNLIKELAQHKELAALNFS